MKISASGGGNEKKFEQAPAGSYAAVCVRVIDLGTQESNWEGEKKYARKVRFQWELNEPMSDGRPYICTRDFTASLHEKSAMRQFLNAWRGQDFNNAELGGFDPKVLLGKACMITLVQKGEYTNVASAAKLPKGMQAPAPVGELIYLSLDEFDQAAFDKLGKGVQEKIAKSPEYLERNNDTHPADAPFSGDDGDSLPF